MSAGSAGMNADDAGMSAGDTGMSAGDTGMSTDDAGMSADDAGMSAGDAGMSADDAGMSAGDAGMSAGDAGMSADDAGMSADDAGMSTDDAGGAANPDDTNGASGVYGVGRPLDAADRAIVAATQGGLPPVPRPYHALAARLGIEPGEVMRRLQRMLDTGAVRRIAAVPNHYALGYHANGMSVWDVDDDAVSEAGREVGALAFVSHCYRRPRHPPLWPYNLFAMVHGRSRAAVEARVAAIATVLGARQRAHSVLYSRRILKKTGLRIRPERGD